MKKFLTLAALAMFACSCIESSVIRGNGKVAEGVFDISLNYTELSVSSGIRVELIHSLSGEGSISADEEVLRHVSIVEENGRVKVSYEPFVSVRTNVETVVRMPLSSSLVSLDASSAGKITGEVRLTAPSMEVDCSSAAEMELDLDVGGLTIDLGSAAKFSGNVVARTFNAEVGSAAVCNIEGRADYLGVEADSAGSFRAFGLVCARVDADASSAGGIEITATEELNARATSGGSVRYKGSPVIVKRDSSSGGSVRETN
jgi:hypothetical protein